MTLKKRVQLLKAHLAKKFPKVAGIGFYLSHRSNNVHMGLDIPLYSIKNYPNLIEQINKLLAKDLDSRLSTVSGYCKMEV